MHSIVRFALLALLIVASTCENAQSSPLLNPNPDSLAQQAPDSFRVEFTTSRGAFVVQAVRAWAPHGVDRFYYLARHGYYDRTKFFRNLPEFMAQFGLHGDPDVNAVWMDRNIPDDSVRQSNLRGSLSFAMGGPNTRSTQLFINKRDNSRLDAMGFAPIGRVIEGMQAVDSLYEGYGEGPPGGFGPDQGSIISQGNRYLESFFPRLDSIVTTRVVRD
jgi:peptidyl-prolyl cis-trans isomerase A (cyclophilin A)